MLNAITLTVIKLSVTMLIIIMLNVVKLSVIMLRAMVWFFVWGLKKKFKSVIAFLEAAILIAKIHLATL
jgi:hypothetical protein